MTALFEVTAKDELVALCRALLAAKFSPSTYDQDVPGSRPVANMAMRIADRMIEQEPDAEQWLAIDRRPIEWRAALMHVVSQRAWWRSAPPEARADFARIVLAPFRVDVQIVDRLISEVEDILANRRWFSLWRAVSSPVVRVVSRKLELQGVTLVAVVREGVHILFSDEDEHVVTDWLIVNGFQFLMEGILEATITG